MKHKIRYGEDFFKQQASFWTEWMMTRNGFTTLPTSLPRDNRQATFISGHGMRWDWCPTLSSALASPFQPWMPEQQVWLVCPCYQLLRLLCLGFDLSAVRYHQDSHLESLGSWWLVPFGDSQDYPYLVACGWVWFAISGSHDKMCLHPHVDHKSPNTMNGLRTSTKSCPKGQQAGNPPFLAMVWDGTVVWDGIDVQLVVRTS